MTIADKIESIMEKKYSLPPLKLIKSYNHLEETIDIFIDELIDASFNNFDINAQYLEYNKKQIVDIKNDETNKSDFWFGYASGLLTYAVIKNDIYGEPDEEELLNLDLSIFELPDLNLLNNVDLKTCMKNFEINMKNAYYFENGNELLFYLFNETQLCDLYENSKNKRSFLLGNLVGSFEINEVITRKDLICNSMNNLETQNLFIAFENIENAESIQNESFVYIKKAN